MDINLLRSLVTVVALAAFLGIIWWAYAPARKAKLEAAGRSVLEEENNRE
jgi:cbb3-type cytochrome oxidase subunit 3